MCCVCLSRPGGKPLPTTTRKRFSHDIKEGRLMKAQQMLWLIDSSKQEEARVFYHSILRRNNCLQVVNWWPRSVLLSSIEVGWTWTWTGQWPVASGCFSYILHTAGAQIWPSGMKVAEIVAKTAMPTVRYKYNIQQTTKWGYKDWLIHSKGNKNTSSCCSVVRHWQFPSGMNESSESRSKVRDSSQHNRTIAFVR